MGQRGKDDPSAPRTLLKHEGHFFLIKKAWCRQGEGKGCPDFGNIQTDGTVG